MLNKERLQHSLFVNDIGITANVIIAVIGYIFLTIASSGLLLFFFTASYLALFISFVYFRKSKVVDLFEPSLGLSALLFLYSLSSAIFAETQGSTPQGDILHAETIRDFYKLVLIGFSALLIGILLSQRLDNTESKSAAIVLNGKNKHSIVFWIAIVFSILFINSISQLFTLTPLSYGETAFSTRLAWADDRTSGVNNILLCQIPLTFILAASVLGMFSCNIILKIIGAFVFALYLSSNFLAGWRGAVIAAAVIPVIYYNYHVKLISKSTAVIGSLCVYLIVNGMTVLRASSAPGEMVDYFFSEISNEGFRFLEISQSGELLVGVNLMRLIEGVNAGETRFKYLESIGSEAMTFIPRTILQERPMPLSEQYAYLFYPDVHQAGGGFGFFIIQEGYWSAGEIGVIISMLLFGFMVQKVYNSYIKMSANAMATIAYSYIYFILVIGSVRTGIMGSVKGMLMALIPFLVYWIIDKVINMKARKITIVKKAL